MTDNRKDDSSLTSLYLEARANMQRARRWVVYLGATSIALAVALVVLLITHADALVLQ